VFSLRFCCLLMNLLGRIKASCVDFSLFVGSLDILLDGITGSIVSIIQNLRWNVMLSASIASCVTAPTTTHFSRCTGYSWQRIIYSNSCCCNDHDCLMAYKGNTMVTKNMNCNSILYSLGSIPFMLTESL
jgi:hypothetical protein